MKYLLIGAGVVVAALAIFAATVFGVSEMKLRSVKAPPAFNFPISDNAEAIERGRHIARTRGCLGCHGEALEGRVFDDQGDWAGRAVAPNLAKLAKEHDAAVLEAAIRHGVGRDGRAFWSMPSFNFIRLSDEDTAAVIAFLKAAPVTEKKLPRAALGWPARWSLFTGAETHFAAWGLDVPALRFQDHADPSVARGEYLAMTTCNECHSLDLRGTRDGDGYATPDLAMVAGYPEADFRRLMKEGVGVGERDDLGLMTLVAKDRFASFTDQELADLRAFYSVLATEPAPEGVWWRK